MGLFGGTFDPPHFGHLVVAQEALERLSLDRLIFLVAGLPPHKVGEVLSPPRVRLEMTTAAVAGNGSFEVSDLEIGRDGPSYTVDTLRHFRSIQPDAEIFFILGADQLAEFHEWQEPDEVASLCTLVVVSRNGVDPDRVQPVRFPSGKVLDFLHLEVPRVDLSSSEIRARVRGGKSIRYLVPSDVLKIIETHRLYRSIS